MPALPLGWDLQRSPPSHADMIFFLAGPQEAGGFYLNPCRIYQVTHMAGQVLGMISCFVSTWDPEAASAL
jgi:hypothetical protein